MPKVILFSNQVMSYVGLCPGYSGEEKGKAVIWSPPGGELGQVSLEAARQTW